MNFIIAKNRNTGRTIETYNNIIQLLKDSINLNIRIVSKNPHDFIDYAIKQGITFKEIYDTFCFDSNNNYIELN